MIETLLAYLISGLVIITFIVLFGLIIIGILHSILWVFEKMTERKKRIVSNSELLKKLKNKKIKKKSEKVKK